MLSPSPAVIATVLLPLPKIEQLCLSLICDLQIS